MQPYDVLFTGPGLNRAAGHRDDQAWLDQAARRPEARIYLFAADVPLLKPDEDLLWSFEEAARFGSGHETVFLGLANGASRFARRLGALVTTENGQLLDGTSVGSLGVRPLDLRTLMLKHQPDIGHHAPLAQAKAVLHWHQRHQFCAHCGAKSVAVHAGWRRDCPQCQAQHFPRTDPVVIMLAIHGDRCLMGRSSHFPPKVYSSLAGFMEPGETIDDAVRREVMEEAGIHVGRVRQLANQPWPFPASLMIACFAEATSEVITRDDELEDCRWFTRSDCTAMLRQAHPEGLLVPPPLGISHALIRAFIAGEAV